MSELEMKQAVGRAAAAQFVRSGMRVGLGTGSTAVHVVDAVGEAWTEGRLRDLVVVPTSEATAAQARRYSLPIVDLGDAAPLDVTIDGADEVDPAMTLVKGRGGAALREKIVAKASRSMVVTVDETKLVRQLGSLCPLPVEVEPFGWKATVQALQALGCAVTMRLGKDGDLFRTDGNHYIADCRFAQIADAADLETAVKRIPGALECGLFVGIASHVLVGRPDGVFAMQPGGTLVPCG